MKKDTFGIGESLRRLERAAVRAAVHPSVVAWAAKHDNDPAQMLSAIQRLAYVPDPVATEWLVEPQLLIDDTDPVSHVGPDADDRCVLLAAALVSAGYECRVVAHGYGSGGFSNCIVEVLRDGAWVPCETTVKVPIGQLAQLPERTLAGEILHRRGSLNAQIGRLNAKVFILRTEASVLVERLPACDVCGTPATFVSEDRNDRVCDAHREDGDKELKYAPALRGMIAALQSQVPE